MRDSIERRDSAPEEEKARVHSAQMGPIHVRSVFVGARRPGRFGVIALAIAALVLGGAFLLLGLLLLTAIAASGAILGGGYLLWRRMRGAIRGRAPERGQLELDPSMEIVAPDDAGVGRDPLPPDRQR